MGEAFFFLLGAYGKTNQIPAFAAWINMRVLLKNICKTNSFVA